ncbi:helix-turn-helix domain protein [Candidatus Erwinia dacicola]|uniref:Helix-turn-helix domain protein n=1 Tax=Candidatus Erwinia dacicola TaxID=252393 RepID=A0A328TLN7_9GAMM|nr:helix-turn-helix domain protein [Candidatus Erwinia dacicola]
MRRTFTAKEKSSVFELWKNGTSFSEIANILGSKLGTIFTMLRDTGGIKPNERKRAVAHLTLSEREEIRAGLSAKMSIRAIATTLNRSPSTILREVQRNRSKRYYKAVDANNRASKMEKRPKPCLLDQNFPLGKLDG